MVTVTTQTFGPDNQLQLAIVRLDLNLPADADLYLSGKAIAKRWGPFAFRQVVFDTTAVAARFGDKLADLIAGFRVSISGRNYWVVGAWPPRRVPKRASRLCSMHDTLQSALAAAQADEQRRWQNAQRHAKLRLANIDLEGGLDEVRFGMPCAAVRELLGEPDMAWVSSEDNRTEWLYDEIDLNLVFEPITANHEQLSYICSGNPRLRFLGVPLINVAFSEVEAALKGQGVTLAFDDGNGSQQFFHQGPVLTVAGGDVVAAWWLWQPQKTGTTETCSRAP